MALDLDTVDKEKYKKCIKLYKEKRPFMTLLEFLIICTSGELDEEGE